MDETRENLNSIIPFLPLVLRSSSLCWPPRALEALKAISKGPDFSGVDSGAVFFDAITDIRDSVCLSGEKLNPYAADGYALFFDDLISHIEASTWFGEVLPTLANLLLQLPSLLEEHYRNADSILCKDGPRNTTGLRILGPQEAGIVFLSQELIGSLLSCSLFCLFPVLNRGAKHLPIINFDHLFGHLYSTGKENQENKVKCIMHYFQRICTCMPKGSVSFERKVLSLGNNSFCIKYPDSGFWSKSVVPLCSFQVLLTGFIEDQQHEALEVDFANKYIGGGALRNGCVQEEIRFMINPESIVAMFFLPSMADNEAIEIVGAERFSNYTGYASSFFFMGNYIDKKPVDSYGRRKTRIVAIDALCSPGTRQYRVEGILRETNKAFCGFFDQSNCQQSQNVSQQGAHCRDQFGHEINFVNAKASHDFPQVDGHSLTNGMENHVQKYKSADVSDYATTPLTLMDRASDEDFIVNCNDKPNKNLEFQDNIGVATGNWGCGAFGGDPELKSIIQWLAASQALRPFIIYYTFREASLLRLEEVTRWILSHKWTVGDVWNLLVEFSSQRLTGEIHLGFLDWLLPSTPTEDITMAEPPMHQINLKHFHL